MHHGLENNCFFSIAQRDFWKCAGEGIIGEMKNPKEYPGKHPCSAYDPCPAPQEITEKSLSPTTIIMFPKNHPYESERQASPNSQQYRDWNKGKKNSHSCP